MRTRNAKKTVKNVSAEQFADAVRQYADACLHEQELNGRIEAEVKDIVRHYDDELQALAQGKATAYEVARSYCLENKEALFARRRSIGTTDGIAGFRLGTPRLRPAKGRTWDTILVELKYNLPGYVRTAELPARDLLLADRHTEQVAPILAKVGLEVVQDEIFYLETRKAA